MRDAVKMIQLRVIEFETASIESWLLDFPLTLKAVNCS